MALYQIYIYIPIYFYFYFIKKLKKNNCNLRIFLIDINHAKNIHKKLIIYIHEL